MSEILDGDEWKHAKSQQATTAGIQVRTRAEQQVWLDEQYLRRKMSLKDWRYHTDIVSMLNTDGSFPELQ